MRRQIVIMLLGLMTYLSLPAFAIAGSRNTDSCLILKAVNIVSAGNSGDSVCWDFSQSQVYKKKRCLLLESDSNSKDSLSVLIQGSLYRIAEVADTIKLCAMESAKLRIRYRQCPVLMLRGLQYGAVTSGCFSGNGVYCDRLHLSFNGRYSLQADGRGILVTPDGDTLRSVIRTRQKRDIAVRISPLHAIGDSIRSLNLCEEVFMWYAAESQTPCMVARKITDDKQKILIAKSWYIGDRYDNKDTVSTYNTTQNNRPADGGYKSHAERAVTYTMDVKAGGKQVSVEYVLARTGRIEFILTDAAGIVNWSTQNSVAGGLSHIQPIDCSSLRPGQYILYISSFGEHHSEKFNID